ncbi:chorismate pyruvate-lyase family protein [Okeanomitos corallinicola TIOX110]|uniref:Chorismate pyruvate-lyase family protein n=1 Tax=Okeanomitos corallinicola TIOX110 TaxID=3133117 RepID=A0ABZ2UQB4_9CYAN
MKQDLPKILNSNQIVWSDLNFLQRIILTNDGTLTSVLEQYLGERIQLVKISESINTNNQNLPDLELEIGSEIIDRSILLQGTNSQKNFVYAESKIILERLDENFRTQLLTSKTTIGRLWIEFRLETFKEIISIGKEPAQELSDYFVDTTPDTPLLFRTYRVFANRQPIMIITEKFPEKYFLLN